MLPPSSHLQNKKVVTSGTKSQPFDLRGTTLVGPLQTGPLYRRPLFSVERDLPVAQLTVGCRSNLLAGPYKARFNRQLRSELGRDVAQGGLQSATSLPWWPSLAYSLRHRLCFDYSSNLNLVKCCQVVIHMIVLCPAMAVERKRTWHLMGHELWDVLHFFGQQGANAAPCQVRLLQQGLPNCRLLRRVARDCVAQTTGSQ